MCSGCEGKYEGYRWEDDREATPEEVVAATLLQALELQGKRLDAGWHLEADGTAQPPSDLQVTSKKGKLETACDWLRRVGVLR